VIDVCGWLGIAFSNVSGVTFVIFLIKYMNSAKKQKCVNSS
jgi:hypothetical protein